MPARRGNRGSGGSTSLRDMGEPSWDILAEIRDSVAGCEIVESQDGAYCMKHRRKAALGAVRCGSKEGQADSEAYTRMQLEGYVRGVLGIRQGRTISRLVERRRIVFPEDEQEA